MTERRVPFKVKNISVDVRRMRSARQQTCARYLRTQYIYIIGYVYSLDFIRPIQLYS